ncbi:MAG: Gfo/Idh/MocA family oxidoreductase [Deltaproteobacteria bacterium]|nr:Gfo/Idh/MocA family oxidoreductase [Deltaproteobacteria bacterium]
MSKLRVGMVGTGFMGRVHSNAYRHITSIFKPAIEPVLQAVCARDAEHTTEFARAWGYEHVETDWRRLIARDDIDAIDICVPNHLHKDIALAAARAGKAVLCEKPLATSFADAEAMCTAVEAAGVANTVWFNYRRMPAVTLAQRMVAEGRLGRIYHYRASFLQDWTIAADIPQGGKALWRLDANEAGSGVLGDLLAHCIDTALWINGPISQVSGMTETFVKERTHTSTGTKQPVSIDDACTFMCRFGNGSLGVFESSRYARGHKANYTFEINGAEGSLRWSLEDLHRLDYMNHGDAADVRGWRSIHVSDHGGKHPYMDHWWVPGLQIGYEHSFIHHAADFLAALAEGKPCAPTFRDALGTQRICEAVLASAAEGRWLNLA